MRVWLLCALSLMGCQPRPSATAPGPAISPTPIGPPTSAPPDAAVAAAPAPDAALPPRTLPWVGLPRRGGERLLLEEGKTVTARDGTTVLLAYRNHKHAVDGSTLGIYGFVLTRGADKLEIEVRTEEEIYAEGVFGGRLWAIAGDYERTEVLLMGPAPATPALTGEAAAEVARAEAAVQGLATDGSSSRGNGEGTIELHVRPDRAPPWRAVVGLFTGEVVSLRVVPPPRPPRPRG